MLDSTIRSAQPVAELRPGTAFRGIWENSIAVFRGVPYARPPVGDLRFHPPQPIEIDGELDASVDGPIAPQTPSRLTPLMGAYSRPQAEDCLTLTIWTPNADWGNRPVLVSFHGGAFLTGAGSLLWYDGGRLAREGDIVVVGVNSRLGALGYLCCPGVSEGNLGLLDQEAALAWVRDNIAAFGGNPAEVTILGQSAGAAAAVMMLSREESRPLFKRAIVESAPFRREIYKREEAGRAGQRFVQLLGLDSSAGSVGSEIRRVPVERLLEAQSALIRETSYLGNFVTPFRLVHSDGDDDQYFSDTIEGAASREILLGTVREEASAFLMPDPRVTKMDDQSASQFLTTQTGHAQLWKLYRDHRPAGSPAELLCDWATDHAYRIGSLRLATEAAARGAKVYNYQFDWAPVTSPYRACHCIELPFVFGTFPHWQAEMLSGGDGAAMEALSAVMRKCWISFVRTGKPAYSDSTSWPAYEQCHRMTMRFDEIIEVVGDPGAYDSKAKYFL